MMKPKRSTKAQRNARPPQAGTYRTRPLVSFTLAEEEITQLARMAESRGLNRSALLGQLIRQAYEKDDGSDPDYAIKCPNCGAPKGAPCFDPKTRLTTAGCAARRSRVLPFAPPPAHTQKESSLAADACPICLAPAGKPCIVAKHDAGRANATAERLTRETAKLVPSRRGAK